MKMIDQDTVEYYENAKKVGIKFKKGIDPEIIAKAIKKIGRIILLTSPK